MKATPVLKVENLLVKRGGVTVLDISSLFIREGEILTLIGPNGTGKSTVLLTLACLLKPFRGSIIFKGQRVDTHQAIFAYRRKLSMVFQEPLLFNATVFDNVASGLNIRGMGKGDIQRRVMECLERFGISHLGRRSARKLSGGEAQRTSLARAFATLPEIVFLDEPFASLDPPGRESLIEDLGGILRETQTTAILATHDLQEALRLSDRLAVMNEGKIVQIGPPAEVMDHPVDLFVASFVGMETLMTGSVIEVGEGEGAFTVSISGHHVQVAGVATPGEKVVCGIRPEHVTLGTDPPRGKSAIRNVLSGKILKIVSLGLFCKVYLHCGFMVVAFVTRQFGENLSLKVGEDVTASFEATAVHVIRRGK
ncbi:MAG: ABC transporter ATP-binding protein [Syntrophobacterales bacterium CG_4_9_14_3_um_filter_49_8]|nr:MAG: ABC transporter ATP-binding protein [Syntrophobacterales bacterium CG_4_9_14_3_um_filter_49_8]